MPSSRCATSCTSDLASVCLAWLGTEYMAAWSASWQLQVTCDHTLAVVQRYPREEEETNLAECNLISLRGTSFMKSQAVYWGVQVACGSNHTLAIAQHDQDREGLEDSQKLNMEKIKFQGSLSGISQQKIL